MRIVHIASEFAPLAKAGGLGEVIIGLAREQNRVGEKIEIIIPRYKNIDFKKLDLLEKKNFSFPCLENGKEIENQMISSLFEMCHLYFLDPKHPLKYFERDQIYGYPDDPARFLYFSKAVFEYLQLRKEPIDVLHLHDWHTALLALFMRKMGKIQPKAIVLSLHSVEYQGKCSPEDLEAVGINTKLKDIRSELLDPNSKAPETFNLLRAGIIHADAVVAVSPSYAKEILSPQYGFGLDPLFKKHKSKLFGILNGLDSDLWSPKTDPFIPEPFDFESSYGKILKAKLKAKESVAKKFGLNPKKAPWIGSICRLVTQKGPKLIEAGARETIKNGGSFLLLGSAPNKEMESHFNSLKEEFAGNSDVLLHYSFDEKLAHEIYTALDFLFMPSLYEPCGLAQMIAMRYATIPIVRHTGGLKDTVFDAEDSKIPIKTRNGFSFLNPNSKEATDVLKRAFALFQSNPSMIQSLVRAGLNQDFSWKKSGEAYTKLYRKLLQSSSGPSFERIAINFL